MRDYDDNEINRLIETGNNDEWLDLASAARENKSLLSRIKASLYGPPSDIKFRKRYEAMAEMVLEIEVPQKPTPEFPENERQALAADILNTLGGSDREAPKAYTEDYTAESIEVLKGLDPPIRRSDIFETD